MHVVYINSCRPEDGRWTTETCRHIEFYSYIPVIRAYIIVLCLTLYSAPSDCITQRMETTKIKKKVIFIPFCVSGEQSLIYPKNVTLQEGERRCFFIIIFKLLRI
jgi:hypothetical protein